MVKTDVLNNCPALDCPMRELSKYKGFVVLMFENSCGAFGKKMGVRGGNE